jgi:tryptophan 2,3-dioxygenase
MTVSYASYLQVDALLALQRPLSEGPEHDELLFIVIHQVYELWFKQVLHEVELLGRALGDNDAPTAQRTLKRVLTIMKTLVGQVDVLETMTPLSFNAFRARLETASGFQSAQFRELEFALGQRNTKQLAHHADGARARLEAWLARPSIYDQFLRFVRARGFELPDALLERDLTQSNQPSEAAQAAVLALYKNDPVGAQVAELLVDLDEGLQEWRYRHVKMAERTIGTRVGTGGSSGAEYLKATLFRPVFADLWAIRAQL